MLPKLIYGFLLIFAFSATTAVAQKTYTPEKNSAERAAIFSALRIPVAKELKQKVSFVANNFKVQGNWAFMNGEVRNSDGGAPDWKTTEYQDRIDDGVFDNGVFALLKQTNGKWRVVTYLIGCTDVCSLGWEKQYKAPKAIFE